MTTVNTSLLFKEFLSTTKNKKDMTVNVWKNDD